MFQVFFGAGHASLDATKKVEPMFLVFSPFAPCHLSEKFEKLHEHVIAVGTNSLRHALKSKNVKPCTFVMAGEHVA